MSMSKNLAALAAAALAASTLTLAVPASAHTTGIHDNCTNLNQKWPHGVGRGQRRRQDHRRQGAELLPRHHRLPDRRQPQRQPGPRQRRDRLREALTSAAPPTGAAPRVRGARDEPACRPGSVSARLAAPRSATIHLGLPLPTASCGLPVSSGGPPSNAHAGSELPFLTLLQVGFTEPFRSPGTLVVSYTTVSPLPPCRHGGGLFSVALSRGSPRVGVTHHLALWSPDLPRRVSSPRPPGRLIQEQSRGRGQWSRQARPAGGPAQPASGPARPELRPGST